MKKNMKKKLKLTREQKVIRNLLLIAVLTVLLCTIPKTVEYNRTLQELGIEREDLDAEYIWKCEGEYRTIYIEAWKNFGTEHEPDWTKFELQRTNPLLYYGHYQQHVNVADNMISWVMNADLWLDEEGNEYHVWDIVDTIPMLPEIKLIKMTNLPEENNWRIEIDCLDVDYPYYRENDGDLSRFVPELTFTVDKESKELTWIHSDTRCRDRNMVPSDDILQIMVGEMEDTWLNYFELAQ